MNLSPFKQLLMLLSPVPVIVSGYHRDGSRIFAGDDDSLQPADLQQWLQQYAAAIGRPSVGHVHRVGQILTYAFPLRVNDELLGVLTLLADGPIYQLPPKEVISDRVAPVLVLLARELAAATSAGVTATTETPPATERAAATMLVSAEQVRNMVAKNAPMASATLESVLADARANTHSSITVLFAPERGLIRFQSAARFSTADSALLKNLVSDHLSGALQGRTTPLVVNKMRDQASGKMVPYRFICAALLQGSRQIGTVVCVRRDSDRPYAPPDVTALAALTAPLTQLVVSHTDETTGLLTRAAFEIEAQSLLSAAAGKFSIAFLNVDRLHVVNDLFGFDAGNAVLRNVGMAIRNQVLPGGGVACRLGGDQFAVLMVSCGIEQAQAWAQSLRETIASMQLPPACAGLEVTASIGLAESEADARLEQTLGAAESAAKAAKDRGRDRIETFASNDASLVQRHEDVAIFRKLVGALKAGEFQLHAQPIVSLVEANPAPRYEILVRMVGRDGRVIPPRKFMSAATRYQLLPQLDRWVLTETLRTLAPHVEQLTEMGASFSVNLTGPTITESGFAQVVRSALTCYEVPSQLIAFEITESAAARSITTAEKFVNEMRAIGCKFSLDDFGTGVSSLSYLKSLNVSTLKIDGSFIRDLATNPHSQTMVRAILDIARELKLDTVAEYVETIELASRVAAMGITYAQGYAFAVPRPLNDVLAELLRKNRSRGGETWYAGDTERGQRLARATGK